MNPAVTSTTNTAIICTNQLLYNWNGQHDFNSAGTYLAANLELRPVAILLLP